jgi:hypothetical protein
MALRGSFSASASDIDFDTTGSILYVVRNEKYSQQTFLIVYRMPIYRRIVDSFFDGREIL